MAFSVCLAKRGVKINIHIPPPKTIQHPTNHTHPPTPLPLHQKQTLKKNKQDVLSFPDITLEAMEGLMARVAPTLVTEEDEEEGAEPVVIKVCVGGGFGCRCWGVLRNRPTYRFNTPTTHTHKQTPKKQNKQTTTAAADA